MKINLKYIKDIIISNLEFKHLEFKNLLDSNINITNITIEDDCVKYEYEYYFNSTLFEDYYIFEI